MQLFRVHPVNPQPRLMQQAAALLRDGAVIAYPTDSCYALGCQLGNKEGLERIRRLRLLDDEHHFTLVCRDLSQLSLYARVDNSAFRLLKAFTPGPYTFILRATGEVPRRLQHPKRRTVGLRVPAHPVCQALLEAHGEPLASATLLLPDEPLALSEPEEIERRLRGRVELTVDAGACGVEPTTVVDLSEGEPRLLRRGRGDPQRFE